MNYKNCKRNIISPECLKWRSIYLTHLYTVVPANLYIVATQEISVNHQSEMRENPRDGLVGKLAGAKQYSPTGDTRYTEKKREV